MKMLVCLLATVGFANFAVAYSPIIDGAMSDIKVFVVDDMGEAVPDATISVTFYTAPEKVDVKRGKTDAQGCFSAKGLCIGEAYAWIRKDGYYETKIAPDFRKLSVEEATKRHRIASILNSYTTVRQGVLRRTKKCQETSTWFFGHERKSTTRENSSPPTMGWFLRSPNMA